MQTNMSELNTFPIEDFLNKARIAIKTGQKNLTLSIKETTDLQNSLSVVMTRLAGENINTAPQQEDIVVNFNGGTF
jgi:hypothetical protein